MKLSRRIQASGVFAAICLTHWCVLAQSSLRSDEQILLYPAIAKQSSSGWLAEVRGVIYEPEQRALMVPLIRMLTGLGEEDLSPAEAAIFRERCRHFLVDHERDKKLTALVDGKSVSLGASGADGGFRATVEWKTNLAALASNGLVPLKLAINGAAGRPVPIEIHLLEESGLSVISDIDDTIKVSEVLNHEALLRNTFLRPFKAVTGMAQVYQHWADLHQARFHYVTASPWQLYQPLSEFTRSNGFPAGIFHMKDFRLKDRSAFSVLASPERYKPGVIEPLFRKFPKREFVLVGDSGEKDPEVYGAIARKFPRQVRQVLIRDVTGEDASAARYQKAFKGLAETQWQIFKDPAELRALPPQAVENSKNN